MKKHKILLFIDSLVSGGAQRQILLLANELAISGYVVTLLTYHDIDDLEYMLNTDIEHVCISKNGRGIIVFLIEIYNFIVKLNPIAIIAYLHTPALITRLIGRFAGVNKIITSERNLDLEILSIRYILERLTYKLSSTIVTNSFSIRDKLINILPCSESKVEVIYNAVDLIEYSPMTPSDKFAIRHSHSISENDFVFMLPGRIVQQKNHLALIQAAKMIAEKYPFILVFVGNEIDQKIKHRLLSEMEGSILKNRVLFLGQQKNMREMYCLADVVVLPSLWEGLPNVIIEAMACERPIIASNVSDNDKIVNNNCGYIVEPDNITNLMEAMVLMLTKNRMNLHEMGNNCRNIISKLCSKKTFTDRYIQIIEEA